MRNVLKGTVISGSRGRQRYFTVGMDTSRRKIRYNFVTDVK